MPDCPPPARAAAANADAPHPTLIDDLPVDGAGLDGWEIEVATDIARYSRRWVTQLGYGPADLSATPGNWRRMSHRDDLPQVAAAVDAHLAGTTARIDIEFRVRRRDGGWQWVRSLGQISERAEDGTPLRLAGVHVDIDARRERERALEWREQRLRLALGAGDEGWWDWRLDADRCEYGEHWAEMLGTAADAALPGVEAWLAHVHPEDRSALREALASVRDGRLTRLDHEHRLLDDHGRVRWMLARGRIVGRDENGGTQRIAGVVVDIGERKRAELALAR